MNTKPGRRPKRTAAEELIAAQARVGIAPEPRAAWLLSFVRRPLKQGVGLTGESVDARWDALSFAYGRGWDVAADLEPPTWAEVTHVHMRAWSGVFALLRNGKPIPAEWIGFFYPQRDGRVTAMTRTSGLPFPRAFMVQVYELLRALRETRSRIRFCPVCERPYVTKRNDAKVCPTGSCRTLAWRKNNRKQFQELRRAAYRRSVVKKTGNPNIRVQHRAKEA